MCSAKVATGRRVVDMRHRHERVPWTAFADGHVPAANIDFLPTTKEERCFHKQCAALCHRAICIGSLHERTVISDGGGTINIRIVELFVLPLATALPKEPEHTINANSFVRD